MMLKIKCVKSFLINNNIPNILVRDYNMQTSIQKC